jgi:ferric-dicitrate binding protein FerR (iron transport regulator)
METLKNKSSGMGEFNGQEIERLILARTAEFKIPEEKTAADALAQLKVRIAVNGESTVKLETGRTRMIYLITSIAAGLLLFLGMWQILQKRAEDKFITGKGLHKEYQLPDGSRVALNADSKILWSAKKFINNRHINLEGEAFFNVTKGSTFTISTEKGDVKVLGTSFNVHARDNSFKVSCFTGRVLVSAGNGSVTLSQGESAELSDDDLRNFLEKDLNRTNSWINGEFFYENTCLIRVFEEIERQFNVKIDVKGSENEFFTGSFTNKDLRSALDIVCIPMGLNYEIGRNKKILITEIKQ